MTVLLGGAPSARTEIVLPFIAAFYCEYLVKKIRSKDAWRGVYVLATAFLRHLYASEYDDIQTVHTIYTI